VTDDNKAAQEFLEKYGLTGLSQMIAAAIIKAEQSDPRAKRILFKATIREVCRISLESGVEPTDLCEAAMTILEISNNELTCLRNESKEKKRITQVEEEAAMLEELDQGESP